MEEEQVLTIIESPFGAPTAEERESNRQYALRCAHDSLMRGEAPYASHLLYTQMLDDTIPAEREMGIKAGFAWGRCAAQVAVYTDRGISPGMARGIDRAEKAGQQVVYRTLGSKE